MLLCLSVCHVHGISLYSLVIMRSTVERFHRCGFLLLAFAVVVLLPGWKVLCFPSLFLLILYLLTSLSLTLSLKRLQCPLGAHANPSLRDFALDDSVALGGLARRQADLCSACLELALSAHVHLENYNAQEVTVLSGLTLSHCSGDGSGDYGTVRIYICTCSATPSLATTATGARIRLHLNGGHVVSVVRLLLFKVGRVKRLLEWSFLLFKR